MAAPIRLFQIGQRGIDVVNKPQDLDEAELVVAQNVEVSSSGGQGGLDQRCGMTPVNVTPLNSGAPILSVLDVPAPLLNDFTPTLYASLTDGNWRKSTDGATWSSVNIGATNFNGFIDLGSWRQWPKIMTVGRKIYYIGNVNQQGTSQIPVYSYDGTTNALISYVPPAMIGTVLSTPVTPSIGVFGTAGATSYSYKVVARFGSSHSAASSAGSTSTGNASLSSSNGNSVVPGSPPVPGATSYDVYRTVGGATQGLIGTIPIVAGAFTFGNGGGSPGTIFSDTGLTGDGTSAPSSASGSQAAAPLQVIDMVTDGTFIYAAVIDALPSDPTVYGRLLKFDPQSVSWQQVGANFPTSSGLGAAGCLAFFDGALSYGTYIGLSPATGNTGYLTTAATPLPAGGIIEVKTTEANLPAAALAVFNGEAYVGKVSLASTGTVGKVTKRAALNTWSDVLTGSASAQYNAFTNMTVYNGRLYAGWFSGDANTAAFIKSSADGSAWTTEVTLDKNEMACQPVIFNSELYWVLGKTSANTLSRIIKRTIGGTWSTVDTGFNYTGAIGIVYA